LAKRVRQLGAIQRTARELKSTLNIEEIASQALNCALEITGAEIGLIHLEMKGFPVVVKTHGDYQEGTTTQSFLNGHSFNTYPNNQKNEGETPPIIPRVSSRLMTPIKREPQSFGYLMVESKSPDIFKEDSRHVLALLADHIAIGLENVLLFYEIRMEQERLETVINSLNDGVITVNLEGEIVTYNQSAERIFGITFPERIGKPLDDLFGLIKTSVNEETISSTLKIRKILFEIKAYGRVGKGNNRIFTLSLTPISETVSHPEGTVILFRDVTDQEEMERIQRELIAAISHELRAPLSNIGTIIETITTDESNYKLQPYIRYFDQLKKQTKRLSDFADRMLDVYQLETGQVIINLQPEPIYLLIEKVINDWQVIKSHVVTFTPPTIKSPWVWVDQKAFESILNNLIENAIKYSPDNTKIEIIVELREKNMIACGVKDQGPGIESEFQGKIFNRFYRIDGGDSQKVYGHGLGLYISRNLVEAMGGKIWVESEYGKGSLFAFTVALMEDENEGENFIN
jgi:two-component system sensor histidine kinase VicK